MQEVYSTKSCQSQIVFALEDGVKEIQWTTGRIIDFEYFARQGMRCSDEEYLTKRDRDIYLNCILPQGAISRREILLLWLEAMKNCPKFRKNHQETGNSGTIVERTVFAGDIYEEFLRLLRIIFLISGITAGISLSLVFFSYTGRQPLNIAYFFALVLLPQICLLLVLAASFTASRFNPVNKDGVANSYDFTNRHRVNSTDKKSFFSYPLLGVIIEDIFVAISKRAMIKLSTERKDAFVSSIGIIRQVYGNLFLWPVFIVMQIFGIAFNIGVLLSTLFRVLFFDTAFGWQSTLQVSPQIVARIVEIIAAPWGWLLPSGVGFPDLDQITGSRIILKDGIYNLATNDLVSWWTFICLVILFYGFLPRLILFIAGLLALKRSLEKQNFDHGACSNLISRMVMADVAVIKPDDVQGKLDHIETESLIIPPVNSVVSHFEVEPSAITHVEAKPCIALVPTDIQDFMDMDTFNHLMKQGHGYDIRKTVSIGMDFEKEMDCIETCYRNRFADMDSQAKEDGWSIVVLQEAWQPPIRESLNFLKSIRKVLDKKTSIIVILTGKAGIGQAVITKTGTENFFTSPEKSDWEIWKMKLSTIADPWLTMEKML